MPLQNRLSPLSEALLLWTLAFLILLASSLLFGQGILTKLLATLSFLLLPKAAAATLSPRHSTSQRADFGLHFQNWKAELRLFSLLFLPVLLLFPPLYAAWLQFQHLLPFSSATPIEWQWHFQLPPRFGEWVVDQYLVVALSEEYFYRGYVQSRLHEFWPKQTLLLRPGLWLTALLFSLGHLATFEVLRLSVFFPALLFGFAKEKTQGLLCPVLLHGSCNLLLMVLQASFV
ncbi:MAG: MXAN_2755 family glutamic-type intramembrane protease [Proteobacteria bacterium]|nr:MXAN_2755 family glutamic-type intramembrane protease [Cystobacterineae bacterium]MCL2259324.1 MXAN_2755 family glutamic-type intramembrane protease [Cystobacterineae bacterium]MCL2314233.1 MXAN_2755 family glutamic-type intramembrane protease [Pseudomonadota bacterium]